MYILSKHVLSENQFRVVRTGSSSDVSGYYPWNSYSGGYPYGIVSSEYIPESFGEPAEAKVSYKNDIFYDD